MPRFEPRSLGSPNGRSYHLAIETLESIAKFLDNRIHRFKNDDIVFRQ